MAQERAKRRAAIVVESCLENRWRTKAGGFLEAEMFEKFPPSIRATIEAFFNEPLFGATTDDHALDLANELEVQHPDLSCRFGTNCP